jgi:hypothetical protein
MTKVSLAIAALALLTASASADEEHHRHHAKSIDGSTVLTCGTSTMLFNGATPHHGFMVQINSGILFVNDAGPAGNSPQQQGFAVPSDGRVFETPPKYRPIGPVSVFCAGATTAYVAARAW